MNCKNVNRVIGLYADGELDAGRVEAVASHLRGCSACRTALAQHRRLAQALDGLKLPEPSADFPRTVRLAAERRIKAAPTPWLTFPGRNPMPVGLRIAASVALFLGLGLGGMLGHATYRTALRAAARSGETVADEFFGTLPADEISSSYLTLIGYGE